MIARLKWIVEQFELSQAFLKHIDTCLLPAVRPGSAWCGAP